MTKGFFKEKKKKMPQANWLPGCGLTEGRVEEEKPWKGPIRNAGVGICDEKVDVRSCCCLRCASQNQREMEYSICSERIGD